MNRSLAPLALMLCAACASSASSDPIDATAECAPAPMSRSTALDLCHTCDQWCDDIGELCEEPGQACDFFGKPGACARCCDIGRATLHCFPVE